MSRRGHKQQSLLDGDVDSGEYPRHPRVQTVQNGMVVSGSNADRLLLSSWMTHVLQEQENEVRLYIVCCHSTQFALNMHSRMIAMYTHHNAHMYRIL